MPRFIILGQLKDSYADGILLSVKASKLGCVHTLNGKPADQVLTYERLKGRFGESLIVWDTMTNRLWCAPLKTLKKYQKHQYNAKGLNDYQAWMCRHSNTLLSIFYNYTTKR